MLASLNGCRGEDLSFDCENQQMNFQRTAEDEELPLLSPIPDSGPFPVLMDISEAGLNDLLLTVVQEGVPLAGEIPFGILPQGPGEADFEATSAPEVMLRAVDGCKRCVIFRVEFGIQLDSDGEPLSTGAGWAELAIPLFLEVDEAAGTTTLVADYSEAEIDDWYFAVYGFRSDVHTMLAGAVRILLTNKIQEDFGPKELLTLGSWELGAGDVQLVARKLFIDRVQGKLTLAMHTNLPLEETVGLDRNVPLPEDVPMRVSFDAGLMQAVAYRMLEEGVIPRVYNEDGEADPDGIYGVTIREIEGVVSAQPQLNTRFRVWRFADGYCGFATLDMPLSLGVNEFMTGITVSAGDAIIVEGENEGVGVAAEEEQALVDDNQELVATFRKDLAKQIRNAVNYENVGVENSIVVLTTQDVTVEGNAINSMLNFVVVADPDAGGE